MGQDVFQFRQFAVRQGRCAMRVGTDGVLLGAWCDVTDAHRVLDIGTGSGLISLMVAQRNPKAKIVAVEIDPGSAFDAADNFAASKWSHRLDVVQADFLSYASGITFDLIVANPPFFDSGHAAPDSRRAAARHTESLPFQQLLSHATSLLSKRGRIALIAPSEVKERIEFLAGENNLWIGRRLGVRTTPAKPVRRFLWEFANFPVQLVAENLTIQDAEGRRTAEYAGLTNDFYL